MNVYVPFVNGR